MSKFSDVDFIRYQRQISLPEIGESGQLKINNSNVLIIGCGGLGTSVSLLLAGAGVGNIVLVDDDKVELSNLHRQLAYTESDIGRAKCEVLKQQILIRNRQCRVRAIDKRLADEQLNLEVMLADLVIDCCDNMATRQQINRICHQQITCLISGSATQWAGQFSEYTYVENQPCFACLSPDVPSDVSEPSSCSKQGVLGPVVNMIASVQALAALKRITNTAMIHGDCDKNLLHCFDGKSMSFRAYSFVKNPDCRVCGGQPEAGDKDEHND
ncbi:HesA/MoeB/ThiF family protein [Vibrio quintilis]|uniref:Sulfur carrier protein ThiS adenylyltransferase n=1 Tax=Vibrio quintilis TaxID=1117707 RepID=A0A1M7YUE5_9VIBR|nr:HesA/MoeB/ThiF family protein [Vibrio quintilis]SHO56290.1 Sulfur carrier protein ThiS adenylyltransferase [Vibrio quintilis]